MVDLKKELLERVERHAAEQGLTIHALFTLAERQKSPSQRVDYSCWGKWKRGDVMPGVRAIEILLNTKV